MIMLMICITVRRASITQYLSGITICMSSEWASDLDYRRGASDLAFHWASDWDYGLEGF